MRETECIGGTLVQELIDGLDGVYSEIDRAQKDWKAASPFQCPDGCGCCCVGFEPDLLEQEALYLAAWMLHHQKERALALLEGRFEYPRPDFSGPGCILFDPASPYHCTVYGGRGLICRLFGYSGDRGKDGRPRWKPCRFIPSAVPGEIGTLYRQYDEEELRGIFGAIPPIMADITAQAISLSPDATGDRLPLREALPQAIAKILMLQRFCLLPPDPENPEPNPSAPIPRAS